jgi:hypothetical protein
MHLLGSTALACLNLVGWLTVAAVLWDRHDALSPDPDWRGGGWLAAAAVLAVWLVACLAVGLGYALRCWGVFRCHRDPAGTVRKALDPAAGPWRRRLALTALADYCGHPSGFWTPWALWSVPEFESIRAVVSAPQSGPGEGEPNAAALPARLAWVRAFLASALHAQLGPRCAAVALRRSDFPELDRIVPVAAPLDPQQFAEAMAAPVQKTMRKVAAAINDLTPCPLNAHQVTRLRKLFDSLCSRALAVGLRMRLGADPADTGTAGAGREQPDADEPTSPLEPLCRGAAETAGMLADVIKDSMLDWTPDDEDENAPEEEPLPTMEPFRFVEALRGPAEIALTSLADAINEAPDAPAIRAVPDPCIEVLGDLLDEALKVGLKLRVDAALAGLPALQAPHTARRWKKKDGGARPGAGPTRDWVQKFRRMKADEGNA